MFVVRNVDDLMVIGTHESLPDARKQAVEFSKDRNLTLYGVWHEVSYQERYLMVICSDGLSINTVDLKDLVESRPPGDGGEIEE
jgi:hypothetical protein